jgi:hypothetical protein
VAAAKPFYSLAHPVLLRSLIEKAPVISSDNSTGLEFRPPRGEIPLHSAPGVLGIHIAEADAPVCELCSRYRSVHAQRPNIVLDWGHIPQEEVV